MMDKAEYDYYDDVKFVKGKNKEHKKEINWKNFISTRPACSILLN